MIAIAFAWHWVLLAPFVAILAIIALLVWATLRNERIRGRFRRTSIPAWHNSTGTWNEAGDTGRRAIEREVEEFSIIGPAGVDAADPMQSAGLYENPAGRLGDD